MTSAQKVWAEDTIRRLHDVAKHDWRISFLAHTSNTAEDAARIIEFLLKEVESK